MWFQKCIYSISFDHHYQIVQKPPIRNAPFLPLNIIPVLSFLGLLSGHSAKNISSFNGRFMSLLNTAEHFIYNMVMVGLKASVPGNEHSRGPQNRGLRTCMQNQSMSHTKTS